MKKFLKNSSLVTNTFNRLNINTIECDELKNPLITPYTTDNQKDTCGCDE